MRRGRLPIGVAYVTGAALLLGLLARDTWGQSPALTHRVVVPLVASDPATPEPTPTPPPGNEPPPESPNSYDLIDEALAKSQIRAEQAAIYRVYATFADPRLPEAFRAAGRLPDSEDLFTDFDSLSPSARAILAPFRLRPDHPDSWWFTTDAAGAALMAAGDGDVNGAARPAGPWSYVTGAKIRVNYPPGSTLAATAASFLQEAEDKIFPKLLTLMGKEPPPDCSVACAEFGGSSHYDIYLVPGLNVGGRVTPELPHNCTGPWTTYMQLDPDQSFGYLAHELMHSFQRAFPRTGGCTEYKWLAEATADWAIDFVYKDDFNGDQHLELPDFFNHPEWPLEWVLDEHEYGASIFFFYLTRVGGVAESVVKDIWTKVGSYTDSLKAVNDAIEDTTFEPDALRKYFHDFVTYNWNPDPPWAPLDRYRLLDEIAERAATQDEATITLGGSPDKEFEVPGISVEHLSSMYYDFTIKPDVSTLAFWNGFTHKLTLEDLGDGLFGYQAEELPATAPAVKDGKLWALVKIEGKDWTIEDWSTAPLRTFCLDKKDERVEKLVLIFSNASYDRNSPEIAPTALPPTFFASNMGCWKWEGEATYRNTVNFPLGGGADQTDATVTWEHAGVQSQPPGAPQVPAPGTKHLAIALNYALIDGSVAWQSNGVDDFGCTHDGGIDVIPVAALPQMLNQLVIFNLVPKGKYRRGYIGIGFTPPVTKTISCPPDPPDDPGGTEVREGQVLWLSAVSDVGLVYISGDGRTLSGSVVGENVKWTWALTAIRE